MEQEIIYKYMDPNLVKQLEAVQLICDGMCRGQAAVMLGISKDIFDYKINKLKIRFNANDTPHLIAILFREGLVK